MDRINEVLNRFVNKDNNIEVLIKKYQQDATFNRIIKSLAYGVDEYSIINELVDATNQLQELLKEQIQKSSGNTIIVPYDTLPNEFK